MIQARRWLADVAVRAFPGRFTRKHTPIVNKQRKWPTYRFIPRVEEFEDRTAPGSVLSVLGMGLVGFLGLPFLAEVGGTDSEQISVVDPEVSPAVNLTPSAPDDATVAATPSSEVEPYSSFVWAGESESFREDSLPVTLPVENHDNTDGEIQVRSLLDRVFEEPLNENQFQSPLDENLLGAMAAALNMPPDGTQVEHGAGGADAAQSGGSGGGGGGGGGSAADGSAASADASGGQSTQAMGAQSGDASSQLEQMLAGQQAGTPLSQAFHAMTENPPVQNFMANPAVNFELLQNPKGGPDQFFYQGKDYSMVLTGQAATFLMKDAAGSSTGTVTMEFVGANTQAEPVGVNAVPVKAQQLPGSSAMQLHDGGSVFATTEIRDVWSGVSVQFYGTQTGQLEHDFQVDAYADPNQIRMEFAGASHLSLDGQGDLLVTGAQGSGTLVEHAPTLYQTVNGTRQVVQGSYVLLDGNEVGFHIGSYRHDLALVIDPVVTVLGFNNGTPATVHYTIDGQSEDVSTILTQFSVGYLGKTYNTWCADLTHRVNQGQSYETDARGDLSTAFAHGSQIAAVFALAGEQDLTGNDDEAASVQIVIWDLLPDHNPTSITLSNGIISSGDPDIFSVSLGDNPHAQQIADRANEILQETAGATTAAGWLDASHAGNDLNRGQSLLFPLTADCVPMNSVEGQQFSGTVANFHFVDSSVPAGNFSATIDWGLGEGQDGGTIVSTGGGNFDVTGSHTYIEEGTYTVTVTISNVDGGTVTVTCMAMVSDAALTALPAPNLFQEALGSPNAAGSTPDSVATGDFNGDGNADLVIANFYGNNVSVLLGRGDGTFDSAVNYNVGAGPNGFVIGDFDNDGTVDIAVGNYYSNTVSILPGLGDGTFGPETEYQVDYNPANVMAGADLRGIGRTDLVTANMGAGTVSVLLSNGNGTFASAVNYTAGSGAIGVVAGDFNNDGIVDLATCNYYGNTVSILFGAGDRTFGSPTTYGVGSAPWFITSADLNGDGTTDLAVANFGGGVSVLLANGDGTFAPAVTYDAGAYPTAVVAGDVNGDGKTDLVVGNYGSNNASVLFGNGDGTFQAAQNFGAGSGPNGNILGDFNNDGKPDIAVANQDSNNVSVLLNQSLQAVEGRAFFDVVAKFTDANSFATPDDFSATISWGDGNSSTVTGTGSDIFKNTDGTWSVQAVHAYAQPGTFSIDTVIIDDGGSTTETTNTIYVAALPETPPDLQAQLTQGGVVLTWSRASGAISYDVFRGRVGQAPTLIRSVTGTSYTDSDVASNTTYSYQIIAVNNAGQSQFNQADVTTTTGSGGGEAAFLKLDTSTQGNWHGVYGADGAIVIGDNSYLPPWASVTPSNNSSWVWAGSTTDPRALQTIDGSSRIAAAWYSGTTFNVDLSITDGQAHQVAFYLLDWDSTSRAEEIDVVDLETGETLDREMASSFQDGEYLVWNVAGNVRFEFMNVGSPNAVLSGLFIDPVVPAAPTDLTATAGNGRVTLSWSPVAEATSYNIYRSTTSGEETLYQSGVTDTSLVDTGVSNGTTYYYKVTAANSTGESDFSQEASASPQSNALPPAPIGLTAIGGDAQVFLSWNAVTAAISYNLYRSTASGEETLYQTGITGTSVTDNTVTNGTEYFYEVATVDQEGGGPVSDEQAAQPAAEGPKKAPPIAGPIVVPGNSRYYFQVNFPDQAPWTEFDKATDDFDWVVDGATKGGTAKEYGTPVGLGFVGVTVSFANQPKIVTITLKLTIDGKKYESTTTVYVVQVSVTTPTTVKAGDATTFTSAFAANQAFKVGKPSDDPIVQNLVLPFEIDGNQKMLPPKTILSGDLGADPSKVDQTTAGLEWRALITLNGPTVNGQNNFGVDKINVGFIQHITPVFRSFYGAKPTTLISTIEEKKNVLDASRGKKLPFYDGGRTQFNLANTTFTNATPQQNAKEISAGDPPSGILPTTYDQVTFVNKVELKWDFILDVAAVAPGNQFSANMYFSEAMAPWSFLGSGTIAANTFTWTGANAKNLAPMSWTATPQVKQIELPKPEADGTLPVFIDTYNVQQRKWKTVQ
jgi:fibronectin type 3 domain-containing protein